MERLFDEELTKLKERLLRMGGLVEEAIEHAIEALKDQREDTAAEVFKHEAEINLLDVEIDEMCLRLLALRQPMASDLRFITSAMRIGVDLERMGDLAVNIAERALSLATCSEIDIPFDYTKMAEKVLTMVKSSLDSLVQMDPDLARQVCEEDNEVDVINRQAYTKVQERIRQFPERVDCLIQFPAISSELERIADHATNIAEEVIYLIEGEIVRHSAY